MGISNIRLALEKRYSALTGELQHVEGQIAFLKSAASKLPELEARQRELPQLIDSAAALLKDAYPDWEAEQIPAVKPWTHHLPIPFGSCGRRGMEVLRRSENPMTARQIALQVLAEANVVDASGETIQRTINAIEASLRKHRGRTVISSGKYPAQWRSKVNSDIQFDI